MFKSLTEELADFMPVAAGNRVVVTKEECDEQTRIHADAAGLECTDEQLAFMRAVFCDVKPVFITGGAGVGKSTSVNCLLIEELKRRGLNFAVTASTGIAASHISGRTLHSWAGIGLGPQWGKGKDARDYTFPGKQAMRDLAITYSISDLPLADQIAWLKANMPPEELARIAVKAKHEETYDNWENGKFSGLVPGIKSRIRACEVLIIDEVSFLPGSLLDYIDYMFKRVRNSEAPFGGIQVIFVGDFLQLPPVSQKQGPADWAFKCDAWKGSGVVKCELTKVYRQDDREFIDVLNNIRMGIPFTEKEKEYLSKFVNTGLTVEDLKMTTAIVPTNAYASQINEYVLSNMPGELVSIKAEFYVPKRMQAYQDKVIKALLKGTIHHEELRLKRGTGVLITKNAPGGSLEYVNGTKAFFVGIENTPEGQYIKVIKEDDAEKYDDITTADIDMSEIILLPKVTTTRGSHEDPEDTEFCNESGEMVPKYPTMQQFPVIPSAAITVHKAQGATLSKCAIDVTNAFAPGHVYVALSRLSSPEGLMLSSVDMPVFADKEAVEYYRNGK